MPDISWLILIVVVLALVFDFINGFHDTANSIATSISTRALSPRVAILMAASLNFVGALVSTKVAGTIGKGIVDPGSSTQFVIISALLSAITWNLITWYFGIPSSSSHAIIGGLMGAAMVHQMSVHAVFWGSFLNKIILPLIASPILGFAAGFTFMILFYWLLRKFDSDKINNSFSRLQIFSAALMSYSHGANDAQKSMGIITMALFSGGVITTFDVPTWVKLACAVTMALGTSFGGWKIIKTIGVNMIKLQPINGFAAEVGAATIIQAATAIGAPVSTTHVISTSILGVGAAKRFSSVRWNIAQNIVWAWVLTIPICGLVAGFYYEIMRLFGLN